MKTLTLQEAVAYLGAIQPNGAEQKSLPLISGRRARSRTMFIAGLAAGLSANNGNTILPGTKKETGVTNFENGNLLPKGQNLLVVGVRVLHDTTASVTIPTALWKSDSPAPFKNGELTISQDGQGVLFNSPGTDVTNTSTTQIGNNEDFRPVVPFLLRADASFEIVERLAAGTLTDVAYKIELRCIEFIDGDKA